MERLQGPMNMPVNVKKSGAVLSDGTGVELPLSTAPLADGYTAGLKVFDLMGGRVKDMIARVTGTEKVTTPAGTYDTYVVEVAPVDGDKEGVKLWIAKEGRTIVKSETQIPPAMGGGSVVSELTKYEGIQTMMKFLLWLLLLVVCWPLALLALVLYPVIWLVTLPVPAYRHSVEAVFALLKSILMLPARVLRGPAH